MLPFITFIIQSNIPKNFLISIAVNYPTSISVADIIIEANKIQPVLLSEPYYVSSSDGKTYFNEDAYRQWDLESVPMDDLTPISKEFH